METILLETVNVYTCERCNGSGQVEEYNPSGQPDDWQTECPECDGQGFIEVWVEQPVEVPAA